MLGPFFPEVSAMFTAELFISVEVAAVVGEVVQFTSCCNVYTRQTQTILIETMMYPVIEYYIRHSAGLRVLCWHAELQKLF
jgi:hypothetical protein